MNRSILYDQEQGRDFDFLGFEHDVLLGLGFSVQDILGQTTTVISGFAATPTGPATLTINLAAGRCYQQADADATAVGDIPQDTSVIEQQGFYAGATVTLVPPAVAGHSQWNLIEAQFSQSDVVRAGDPNGGIPPFYNAANPSEPLNGQGNLGDVSPTERASLCIIQVIQGVSATTGSEAPPSPTSGWVPLYLVDLTNGQTQITSGEILVAGPSVGLNVPSNYPAAPFLAGLLSSHHSGAPGQAPKISLTSEVTGVLPSANGGAGAHGQQVFLNTGTIVWPANPVYCNATAGGGAGGLSGSGVIGGGGGGSGDWVVGNTLTGTIGNVYTITIGAAGTTTAGNGGNGGTTSVGSLLILNGGTGGLSGANGGTGGAGGSGTGIGGQTGQTGLYTGGTSYGGVGGGSMYGSGGAAGEAAQVGETGAGFGSGGGGGAGTPATGANGAPGFAELKW